MFILFGKAKLLAVIYYTIGKRGDIKTVFAF